MSTRRPTPSSEADSEHPQGRTLMVTMQGGPIGSMYHRAIVQEALRRCS
ncbi:MAG: hypothetical protein HC893_05280 [Chloroflexaceae bacterium]|nr:hypothetical protein [Chloroflexaceae bacterium]